MLHCGNTFLKQILNFRFKLNDIVPRYEGTLKSPFLGTVGITFFATCNLFKKRFYGLLYYFSWIAILFLRYLLNFQLPNEIRRSQTKLKDRKIIKCQLMTSYMFDPNNFHST